MHWQKLGKIFDPKDYPQDWYQDTFLTPTPLKLDDETIRIYGGLRDKHGVSRIGYVDVCARDPKKVKAVSQKPALDVGNPGCFDDNGVILGDVVRLPGGRMRMYYVGFQKVEKVKFLAFTGLAISDDNGESFVRVQETPVLDRHENGRYIGAIHTAMFDGDKWRLWFAAGNGWQVIHDTPYPQYNIWYTESADGIKLDGPKIKCLDVDPNEYRIGRPRVRKTGDAYELRFTFDTLDKQYQTGTAISKNGIDWSRDDALTGIKPSASGWDSEMLCYPVILENEDKTYMFYSGNNMGATGLGVAIATS